MKMHYTEKAKQDLINNHDVIGANILSDIKSNVLHQTELDISL